MTNSEHTDRTAAHDGGGIRAYTIVWALLMLLTAVTVGAASLDFGKLAVIICLAIASIKSILVLLYFMHLRHEERMIIKVTIPIAIITLAIFIGLTYVDVFTR